MLSFFMSQKSHFFSRLKMYQFKKSKYFLINDEQWEILFLIANKIIKQKYIVLDRLCAKIRSIIN